MCADGVGGEIYGAQFEDGGHQMKPVALILHYGRSEADERMTEQCIRSLWWQGARIVVIDNGSPRIYKPNGVGRIRLERNQFLITAFNAGIEAVRREHDIYFCLNNDIVADAGMVGRLVEVLRDPAVGVVAPGSSDQGTGVLHVPYASPQWTDREAKHVDNHAWGFRRDVVERIGLPDCEGHSHRACWASNRDYCYRARMAGYKVMAVRSAYVTHLGGR